MCMCVYVCVCMCMHYVCMQCVFVRLSVCNCVCRYGAEDSRAEDVRTHLAISFVVVVVANDIGVTVVVAMIVIIVGVGSSGGTGEEIQKRNQTRVFARWGRGRGRHWSNEGEGATAVE